MNEVNESPEAQDEERLLADLALSEEDARETVANLRRELETLESELRSPPPSDPYVEESACIKAVENARAVAIETMRGSTRSNIERPCEQPTVEIGPYKILSLLGRGGMGAVYKALHVRLDKIVALKVLSATRLRNPEAIVRFEREMRAVGKLDHPHLIRALDAGEAGETHYLAMEFVDGVDLAALLKRHGPLGIAEACEAIAQAAAGLQAAHQRGMVHRDIKPANLILAKQEFGPPVVKVLDLGLALLSDMHAANEGVLTSDDQVMGTVDYMAPEQASNSHAVDVRADVYSLGATLYALLSGGSIFQTRPNQTLVQKLISLSRDAAPPIRDLRPEVSEELAAIVHRLLAKNPQERFASAAEVAAALAPFAAGADLAGLVASLKLAKKEALAPGEMESVSLSSAGGIDHATRTSLSLQAEGGPPKRRRPSIAVAGLVALAAFALVAAIVVSLKTPHGEIVVQIPDDVPPEVRKEIEVRVTGDGVAQIANESQGWKIEVAEGKYRVQLAGGADQFTIDEKQVTVSRKKVEIVRVTMKPSADDPEPRDADYRCAAALRTADPSLTLGVIFADGRNGVIAPGQPLPEEVFRLDYLPLIGEKLDREGDAYLDAVKAQLQEVRVKTILIASDAPTSSGIASFLTTPGLSEASVVQINHRSLGDDCLSAMAGLPKLANLEIQCRDSSDTTMTGAGLGRLTGLTGLAVLDCKSLSAAAIQEISQLPQLKYLQLSGRQFTEADLAAIAKLKLESLLFYVGGIDDAKAIRLGAMTTLEYLDLRGNPVTDEGLASLKKLTRLTRLGLNETKVTPAGVADLQLALPRCKIEWDGAQASE